MYKVEIITVVGSFMATVPDQGEKPMGLSDALDLIENQLTEKKSVLLDNDSILRIWDKNQVIAVRAFSAETDDGLAFQSTESYNEALPAGDEPTVLTDNITYLGASHTVTVIAVHGWPKNLSKNYYLLLYEIDGKPAIDFACSRNHPDIVTTWFRQVYQYSGDYEVVVPHESIEDIDEAMEYLKDYVKETALDYKSQEKTGKAWSGWKGGRDNVL